MKDRRQSKSTCCEVPNLAERDLLGLIEAGGLATVFKVLANNTRLRLLHALVLSSEMRVTDLSKAVGLKPQAVSNQLQRLSDLGIVSSRRVGKNILYSLVDLCVRSLLEQALCLMREAASQPRGAVGKFRV
jgi:DNA-binding transcriptional ArsR family regulator